jgi:hypothetical protein
MTKQEKRKYKNIVRKLYIKRLKQARKQFKHLWMSFIIDNKNQ